MPLSMHFLRGTLFVCASLWVAAIVCYPGWSSFYPDSGGYDFRHNFVCDLLSGVTPDGRDNSTSSTLMATSFAVLFVVHLCPAWWWASHHPALRRIARFLGVLATGLALLVCAEQVLSIRFPHGTLTLGAASAAAFPTALVIREDWRRSSHRSPLRYVLVALVVFASTNFVSYSVVQISGEASMVVPIAQNGTIPLLFAWLWLRKSG